MNNSSKPRRRAGAAAGIAALLLGACAVTPPANVHQPMTARPATAPVAPVANGAIYQVQYAGQPGYVNRPLFEDRRARSVGDILTISISETTSASKKSSSNAGRAGVTNASVTGLQGLPGKSLLGENVAATSKGTFAGSGDSASNNVFTGTVTVTVIEVLANGNLLVSGEKQLGINQGSEYVRFSGIVNPASVSASNTVSSTLVADARIEYRGNGYIDEAQTMGWMGRFFMNVLPF